jgi:membrane-associated protease RseP (regulator of RpoE activity)
MFTSAWKAAPLALLLLASWALPAGADDDSPKKKEQKVVITDDDIVVSDKDEPGAVVWRWPGRSRRGYLGVRLLEMTPELRVHFGAPKDAGVLVAGVEKDSPAAKSGIQVGDIITRADGDRIESASDLTRSVRHHKSGDALKLEISRDRAARSLNVKVEERRVADFDIGHMGHMGDLGDLGDLRDLGREIGRSVGRDIGRRALVLPTPPDMDRLRDRVEELEKRLNDLEKKLPSR